MAFELIKNNKLKHSDINKIVFEKVKKHNPSTKKKHLHNYIYKNGVKICSLCKRKKKKKKEKSYCIQH